MLCPNSIFFAGKQKEYHKDVFVCSEQVAFQGIPHKQTLKISDRFGNHLDNFEHSGFNASLIGTPDPRAELGVNDVVSIQTTISNATGKIVVSFTPEVAGSYVMTYEYTGRGGLLATFFRTKDFTHPILESPARYIEVKQCRRIAVSWHATGIRR